MCSKDEQVMDGMEVVRITPPDNSRVGVEGWIYVSLYYRDIRDGYSYSIRMPASCIVALSVRESPQSVGLWKAVESEIYTPLTSD